MLQLYVYILKFQIKQLIVFVHSLFQITILIFIYYTNKELQVYLNCLQIYAYINANNG